MTSWPGYPPPPPPRPPTPWYRSLWLWLSVYGTVIVVGGVALLAVLFHNIAEPLDDATYWVEQESVNEAVVEPCEEMADAAAEIQIFSTPSVGAASLLHFVEVGRGIPRAIDSVADADDEARRWRNDWNVVLNRIEEYAHELESDGSATFDTPVDRDGDPVIGEMAWVSDVGCEVPTIITALDPDYQIYY